jgi:hypothetical protein
MRLVQAQGRGREKEKEEKKKKILTRETLPVLRF